MSRTLPRLVASLVTATLLFSCSQSPTTSQETLPPGSPYAGGAQYPWTDKLEAPVADPYTAGRDYPWHSPVAAGAIDAQGLSTGITYLSDLPWTSATSGWGPISRDQSNGEMDVRDGHPLTIGGQTYSKGLGVHADSTVKYALNGQCSNFSAYVGLDDEVGTLGRVTFQVLGDGNVLYDSGEVTGADTARAVFVNTTGVKELTLRVLPGVNNYYDHADWADATINCTALPPQGDVYLSDLPYVSAENGWGPVEMDKSNREQPQFDGQTLTIGGQTFTKGLGVHAPSAVTYSLAGNCSNFTATVGLDDEVGDRGSVIFKVYGDGTKLYDSGVKRGTDSAQNMSVNVSGVQQLRLVVTDAADNKNYDHADWANAKLNCTAAPVMGGHGIDPSFTTTVGGVDSITDTGDTLVVLGSDYRITRLNTSGTVLASGSAGLTDSAVLARAFARQADGKFVAVGDNWVVRYNTDLTLDATFGAAGKVNLASRLWNVALQPDGKIVIADYANALARLNTNGSLDTTFGTGGYVSTSISPVFAVAVQSDGKIIAGGIGSTIIQRFLPDGTLDTTFAPVVGGRWERIDELGLLPNGKIVARGFEGPGAPLVQRLNQNGSIDIYNMFSRPAGFVTGELFSMLIRGNEDILIGGYYDDTNNTSIRHHFVTQISGGSWNTAFGLVSVPDAPNALASDSMSRIYVTMPVQTIRVLP